MNKLTNLYQETDFTLRQHFHQWNEVLYVRSNGKRYSVEQFEQYAKQIDYDKGYGLQVIRDDVMLVGKKFIFIREEYDGSEWWRYINLDPERLKYASTITEDDLVYHYVIDDQEE